MDRKSFLMDQYKAAQEALSRSRQEHEEKISSIVQERDEALGRLRSAEEAFSRMQIDTAWTRAALEAGLDSSLVDLALQSVDRSGLTLEEDGSVQGVRESLDALRSSRPSLFRTQTQSKGRSRLGDWIRERGRQ